MKVTKEAERYISEREYDNYDGLIARLFFGTRIDTSETGAPRETPPLRPIQVLTAIDALDKEYAGLRRAYDELSEIAHPNSESLFAISDWRDVGLVSLDPAGARGDLLGKILSAIRLDIAGSYLVRWEKDLASQLGRIWKENQSLPSMDDSGGNRIP